MTLALKRERDHGLRPEGYKRSHLHELLPARYARLLPPAPNANGTPCIEALHCAVCRLIIEDALREAGDTIDRNALAHALEVEHSMQKDFKRLHAARQEKGMFS